MVRGTTLRARVSVDDAIMASVKDTDIIAQQVVEQVKAGLAQEIARLTPRVKNWRVDGNGNLFDHSLDVNVEADLDGTVVGKSASQKAKELFMLRMGGVTGQFILRKADFLKCHVTPDMVHLFYCFDNGNKAGNLAEPVGLFPSDTLIAQFRLILLSE